MVCVHVSVVVCVPVPVVVGVPACVCFQLCVSIAVQ